MTAARAGLIFCSAAFTRSSTTNGRFAFGPERRITFRVLGTPYTYRVLEGGELLRLLRTYPRADGEFLVGFRLHDRSRWRPAAITINSFELVAPPAPQPGR